MSSQICTYQDIYNFPTPYNNSGMRSKNYIKEIRKQKCMTQEQVATALDISHVQVGRHEKGEQSLSIEWAHRYAAIFNCSIMDILEGPNNLFKGYNQSEADLLEKYRGLSESEKKMFSTMLTTFSDEKSAQGQLTEINFQHNKNGRSTK